VEQISAQLGEQANPELVFKLVEHLAANPKRGIAKEGKGDTFDATYRILVQAK
jgi:hypothetical protein